MGSRQPRDGIQRYTAADSSASLAKSATAAYTRPHCDTGLAVVTVAKNEV